jgi:hypothetical protein
VHLSPTLFVTKKGYGVEMLEIIFNEEELYKLFTLNNLYVQEVVSMHTFPIPKLAEQVLVKTYVCKKINAVM